MTNEHAGFLMGQGLNGHLAKLATLNVHDYLIKVCYPHMPIDMAGIYHLLFVCFFVSLLVHKFFVTDISGVC